MTIAENNETKIEIVEDLVEDEEADPVEEQDVDESEAPPAVVKEFRKYRHWGRAKGKDKRRRERTLILTRASLRRRYPELSEAEVHAKADAEVADLDFSDKRFDRYYEELAPVSTSSHP